MHPNTKHHPYRTKPGRDNCVECWKHKGDPRHKLHLSTEYDTGTGHIEIRADGFLVSFYGRRVQQEVHSSLQVARFALRRLAMGAK